MSALSLWKTRSLYRSTIEFRIELLSLSWTRRPLWDIDPLQESSTLCRICCFYSPTRIIEQAISGHHLYWNGIKHKGKSPIPWWTTEADLSLLRSTDYYHLDPRIWEYLNKCVRGGRSSLELLLRLYWSSKMTEKASLLKQTHLWSDEELEVVLV